jgi:hypothetical protein
MVSTSPAANPKRRVFARLSIAVGNTLQIGGILAAWFALTASRSAHSIVIAVITMLLAWVLLYFSSHAIAHWLIGRLEGFVSCFIPLVGREIPKAGRAAFVGSLSACPSLASRQKSSRCKTSVPEPEPLCGLPV